MTLRRDTLRRAAAALLTLSAAGAAVATVDAIARAPTLALWETVAPEAMGPEALRLHIDSLLAETVDAAWLEAETEAALAETPPAWGRLDALEALAAERGLALPPALAARRAAAMADRPSAIGACLGGLTAAALPDDATAIGCYFGAALTPVGDVKALGVEGARAMRGEEPDWTTVSLAAVGVGALALGPAGLPARYAVATLRTARKLGALSAGLAAEIADIGRRVVRFDRAAAPADWVDPGALRALGAPVMDIGRVARSAGSVTAVRALRHVETLDRSEEHTSELQSHAPISYAVFCLKKKK